MFGCFVLVANSSEIQLTFLVETNGCEFGFTELDCLSEKEYLMDLALFPFSEN
jgi:hypothetical protein